MKFRFLLIFIIFIFFTSSVFGAVTKGDNFKLTSPNKLPYLSGSYPYNFTCNLDSDNKLDFITGKNSQISSCNLKYNKLNLAYIFPITSNLGFNSNFVLFPFTGNPPPIFSLSLRRYRKHDGSSTFYLDSPKCSIILTKKLNTYNLKGNFNENMYNDYFQPLSNTIKFNNGNFLLDNFYYMKTLLYFKVSYTSFMGSDNYYFFVSNPSDKTYNYENTGKGTFAQLPFLTGNGISQRTFISSPNGFIPESFSGTSVFPYFLATTSHKINLDSYINKIKAFMRTKLRSRMFNGRGGSYKITLYAVPIDGKCDYLNNGNLIPSEYTVSHISVTKTIKVLNQYLENNSDNITSGFGNFLSNGNLKKNVAYLNNGILHFNKLNSNTSLSVLKGSSSITLNQSNVISKIPINTTIMVLNANKIRNFRTANNISSFIDNSFNTMNSLNITKTIQTSSGSTNVKIEIRNITTKNITIYQIFRNNTLKNIKNQNDIKVFQNGKSLKNPLSHRSVIDGDPVIGWYFNNTNSGSVGISYTNSGNTGAGLIIITSKPILYNFGNLIVTYKQGGCAVSETELFQLDNLSGSKIYKVNSDKAFQVCISDLNTSQISGKILNNLSGDVKLHLFNTSNSRNVSFNNTNGFINSYNISVYNNTPKLNFDLEIAKSPPSNQFSCLGSIMNLENSTFGDCSFNPFNKIWIHLSKDTTPPITTLSYPFLAHTMTIFLRAKDNVGGSGVANISYSIGDGNTSYITISKASIYFTITCPYDFSCKKTINYFATDKAGNNETMKTKVMTIIQKGSACQEDCTAAPSPNRYIAECRNLNKCVYYPINSSNVNDGGVYVANQCNLLTKGSFAPYGSNSMIKCPNGPIVPSFFTSIPIKVTSVDKQLCFNILKNQFPILINGKQAFLDIFSCES